MSVSQLHVNVCVNNTVKVTHLALQILPIPLRKVHPRRKLVNQENLLPATLTAESFH